MSDLNDSAASVEAFDPYPHRWKAGQSGNPRGRPKGIKQARIAEVLLENGSAIVQRLVDAALAGDTQAAGILMARLHPPLRARGQTVEFELDTNGSLSQQAAQVLQAVAQGCLDPETGKLLIDTISAFVGLRDAELIEARIIELESKPVGQLRIDSTRLYQEFIGDLRKTYGLPAPEGVQKP